MVSKQNAPFGKAKSLTATKDAYSWASSIRNREKIKMAMLNEILKNGTCFLLAAAFFVVVMFFFGKPVVKHLRDLMKIASGD